MSSLSRDDLLMGPGIVRGTGSSPLTQVVLQIRQLDDPRNPPGTPVAMRDPHHIHAVGLIRTSRQEAKNRQLLVAEAQIAKLLAAAVDALDHIVQIRQRADPRRHLAGHTLDVVDQRLTRSVGLMPVKSTGNAAGCAGVHRVTAPASAQPEPSTSHRRRLCGRQVLAP